MGTNPLIDVLKKVYEKPRSLQSDFIRDNSQVVARLASCGLITTRIPMPGGLGAFSHQWRLTYKGIRVLEMAEPE